MKEMPCRVSLRNVGCTYRTWRVVVATMGANSRCGVDIFLDLFPIHFILRCTYLHTFFPIPPLLSDAGEEGGFFFFPFALFYFNLPVMYF